MTLKRSKFILILNILVTSESLLLSLGIKSVMASTTPIFKFFLFCRSHISWITNLPLLLNASYQILCINIHHDFLKKKKKIWCCFEQLAKFSYILQSLHMRYYLFKNKTYNFSWNIMILSYYHAYAIVFI